MTVHGGKGTFPMADIHNDDPRDLLELLAKSMAYPLANMFLGNADNGEVVLAVNPMWAERFGAAFPDVEELQLYAIERDDFIAAVTGHAPSLAAAESVVATRLPAGALV